MKTVLALPAVWLLWLLHFLPLPVLAVLGDVVGALLGCLAHRRRRIVETNIGWCFPELSPAEQQQLVRRHFRALARSLLDRSVVWWASERRLRRLIQVDGEEKLRELLLTNTPVVLLAPHFVGLDAGGIAITQRFDIVSLYAEQSNAVFNRLLLNGRRRFGNQLLLSRQDGIRASIKAMRSGRPFYYLPDTSGRRRESAFVPFFGIPTATVTATSRLARAAGARLVPCVTRMLANGQGYRVEIGDPWPDFPSEDIIADTARINAWIESVIRTMPEQYYWVHRRFKLRPDGEPGPY